MLSLHDRSICGKILSEVRDGIAGDLHGGGGPGIAGGELWEHAGSVIHKIGVEAGGFDLLLGQISGELVDDGGDHLQVAEFFRSGELSAYQMAGIGGEFDLGGVLKISKQALMDASRTSRCT